MVLRWIWRSSRWVAKLWRNVCSVTPFLIPAASAASWNKRLSWRVVIGLPADFLLGNNQRSRRGTGGTHLPPLPQQAEHLLRQHHIAVLAALRLLDANDLLCLVDMLDLEPDDLARPQSAAIAEAEQNARLEA